MNSAAQAFNPAIVKLFHIHRHRQKISKGPKCVPKKCTLMSTIECIG